MSSSSRKSDKTQLTLNDIRYNNTVHLFTDIVSASEITRNDLAAKNGISLMTVKKIVDDLLKMGLVEEHQQESSIGRKPMALRVSSRYGNIVCLNFSTLHKIRFIIYDISGQILEEGSAGCKARNQTIHETISDSIEQIRTRLQQIRTETIGVAVFLPGVYYPGDDIIKFAMFEELNDLHIKTILREEFRTANVQIIHDTLASAGSEYKTHTTGNDSQFYLYCGDGVGGCFTNKDGNPVLGENLLAGEVGNLIVFMRNDGTPVRLEELVSIEKIKEKLPSPYCEMDFDQVVKEYGKHTAVTQTLDEASQAAALALYNLVWIYNPARIIVDSYCKEYADLIICRAIAFFREHFDESFLQNVEIKRALSEEYHTMYGCMTYVRDRWIRQAVVTEDNLFGVRG